MKTRTEEDGWDSCVSGWMEAADTGDTLVQAHHQVGGEIGELGMEIEFLQIEQFICSSKNWESKLLFWSFVW